MTNGSLKLAFLCNDSPNRAVFYFGKEFIMARVFIDSQEMTNKDEFDNKVNVTNSLYLLKQTPYNLQDVLSNEYRDKTLGVIHNRFIDSSSTIIGSYDSLLVFGGDDVKHSIDIGLNSHKVRISTKSSGIFWQEDLVLKSDYDKLANRVSVLEKQIGGVKPHYRLYYAASVKEVA